MEQPGYTSDWSEISSAFQWITKFSRSSSSQEWQRERASHIRNIAFYDHSNFYFFFFFLMGNECYSMELMGARDVGVTQEVLNTIPCWHTVCLLPHSDFCKDLHSSVLADFTSISGWEREGSLWQVGFELLPQPGLTPSFWGDLYSSSVEAGL